jgi:hypothetical protein
MLIYLTIGLLVNVAFLIPQSSSDMEELKSDIRHLSWWVGAAAVVLSWPVPIIMGICDGIRRAREEF